MSTTAPEAHGSPDEAIDEPHEPQQAEQEHRSELDQTLRSGGRALARTALVTSMASELAGRAHNEKATPESRRLAIELASQALGRHYAKNHRRTHIVSRYM